MSVNIDIEYCIVSILVRFSKVDLPINYFNIHSSD